MGFTAFHDEPRIEIRRCTSTPDGDEWCYSITVGHLYLSGKVRGSAFTAMRKVKRILKRQHKYVWTSSVKENE